MDVWFGCDCVCSNIECLSNIDEITQQYCPLGNQNLEIFIRLTFVCTVKSWGIWQDQKRELREGDCISFFCHNHSHIDISNYYLLEFCPKLQDKHCIKHFNYDYDRKIRYKIGPWDRNWHIVIWFLPLNFLSYLWDLYNVINKIIIQGCQISRGLIFSCSQTKITLQL